MKVSTIDLRPGMRVALPLGHVRTVESVTSAGYVNGSGVTIHNVRYAEGATDGWSGGNSGASDALWDVQPCSCARHDDGSVTTYLCPVHADDDPCATMAAVTGRRRRGSVVRGRCSACGWSR